jgi:hypothetical protein
VVGSADGYHSINESDSIGIAKLKSYLRANYVSQNLYNKTWLLLASARLVDLLNREQASALAAELRHQQNADGGWSLYRLGPWTWSKESAPYGPPGKPDVAVLCQSDAYATRSPSPFFPRSTPLEARIINSPGTVPSADYKIQERLSLLAPVRPPVCLGFN